ncbi:MAG: ABC transporter permease subunit [Spirochaetales bacterium]|nr:ABC transporter permease subunit [Spirochaetales bacterium]
MFRNLYAVTMKELKSYFNTPIAYIFIIFLLVSTSVSLFYFQQFLGANVASFRGYFSTFPLVFIFLLPALTMRGWAEERKMGTDEILLTLPIKEYDLVLGKFFGALTLLVLVLFLTIPVPLMLAPLGNFDPGQLAGEYLGALLLGAAGISIGLFVSSLAVNQVNSFMFGVLALLAFTMMGRLQYVLNLPLRLSGILDFISLDYHFRSFVKGIIDLRDLGYFILLTFFFLFLNGKVISLRKWG